MEAGTYHREVARADYREQVAQRTSITQRGQKRAATRGETEAAEVPKPWARLLMNS